MISVIIPVYNTEKYLDQCIRSVLSQTYKDFEVLLVNDGSTDSSGTICDKYAKQDTRIKVFHTPNSGVSAARNLGLVHSHGEWITFVDSDDKIDPLMLQTLLTAARANDADIAYCDFNMVYFDKVVPFRLAESSLEKKELIRNWIQNVWTVVAGGLYKRNLFADNSLIFPIEYNYCEDFTVSLKLRWFSKKTIHVKEHYYNYTRYNENSITSASEDVKLEQEVLALKDILNFLKAHSGDTEFNKYIYWRFLDLKQDWCLDKKNFVNYNKYLPECLNYIWDCPKLSVKRKLIIWCVSSQCLLLAKFLLKINNIIKYRRK